MSDSAINDTLATDLFSDMSAVEQMARTRCSRALRKGMELSHFTVLNHFARLGGEKTPAQLARIFHVTKGAMTNTLSKLEVAGYVHIRPDWDDARRKFVSISPAGHAARDEAVRAIAPVFDDAVESLGSENIRAALPFLRDLRMLLASES